MARWFWGSFAATLLLVLAFVAYALSLPGAEVVSITTDPRLRLDGGWTREHVRPLP